MKRRCGCEDDIALFWGSCAYTVGVVVVGFLLLGVVVDVDFLLLVVGEVACRLIWALLPCRAVWFPIDGLGEREVRSRCCDATAENGYGSVHGRTMQGKEDRVKSCQQFGFLRDLLLSPGLKSWHRR